MALSVVLNGTDLNGWWNAGATRYATRGEIDWGGRELAEAIFSGDLAPEDYDQFLAETRFVRHITIPLRIHASNVVTALDDITVLEALLNQASRTSPLNLVVTPLGATLTSTFQIIGGSVDAAYTNAGEFTGKVDAALTLDALPWCYGARQSLGSASTPLATNVTAPAYVIVTPTTGREGDVPADVALVVKSRSSNTGPIRSLAVTAWNGHGVYNASNSIVNTMNGSTLVTDATINSTSGVVLKSPPNLTANTPVIISSWSAFGGGLGNTPTDQPIRAVLRVRDNTTLTRGKQQFRLRLLTGSVEQVGDWRSVPEQASATTWIGADMGLFVVPSTITDTTQAVWYLEHMSQSDVTGSAGLYYDVVEYWVDASFLVVETVDTGKSLVAAGEAMTVDHRGAIGSAGQPLGGLVWGAGFRFRGITKLMLHPAAGYLGALDSPGWSVGRSVDIWAFYTPRYVHLAA